MAIKSEEAKERARLKDRERWKTPKRQERIFSSHLETTYGISLSDYNQMLETQNHLCKICQGPQQEISSAKRLVVDHCHQTGVVRGLLCSFCNSMLGHSKDNVTTLEKAIQYLNKFQ
ncbi:MAG: endonuclease VII domain-containing protein [Bacteroidales bacterium]